MNSTVDGILKSHRNSLLYFICTQREREKPNRGEGASENDNFGIPTKLYIMTALKFGFEINIFYMILVFVIYLLKSIKYKLVLMLARINCYHCITRLTIAKARP